MPHRTDPPKNAAKPDYSDGKPLAELVSPAALEAAIKSMSRKLEQIRIFAESAGDTITSEEAIRMIRALYPPRTPPGGVPVVVAAAPAGVTARLKVRSFELEAELHPPRRRRR